LRQIKADPEIRLTLSPSTGNNAMSILNYFVRMNESAVLMDAMIGKLGLSGAFTALPDHRNVLRRAANRCLGCERRNDCADWLASEIQPDGAPRYCRNHDLFARMLERPSPLHGEQLS
jgi:hypothetical protein